MNSNYCQLLLDDEVLSTKFWKEHRREFLLYAWQRWRWQKLISALGRSYWSQFPRKVQCHQGLTFHWRIVCTLANTTWLLLKGLILHLTCHLAWQIPSSSPPSLKFFIESTRSHSTLGQKHNFFSKNSINFKSLKDDFGVKIESYFGLWFSVNIKMDQKCNFAPVCIAK